jgi:two-component system, chemotaxis family, chemotaxis protein CheY
VLIVDDSRPMRMIVLRTLRQAGFIVDDVLEAADGTEALAAAASFAPDLILADWNMPAMSGIDLLRALRAAGDRTPFGFVTSEADVHVREEAITAGAAFVLLKPFTAERVADAIAAVVG